MEDAHIALPDFDVKRKLGLFGVFDGHGGSVVARLAAETLPKTLQGLATFQEGRYSEALYEAFLKVDEYLDSTPGREKVDALIDELGEAPASSEEDEDYEEEVLQEMLKSGQVTLEDLQGMSAGAEEEQEEEMPMEEDEETPETNDAWVNGKGPDGMGCTAVVALVIGGDRPKVIVANAGDSRCFLARGSTALDLSQDHKPTDQAERKRIEKAGGFVSADGRVDGNLNLSRSLGDFAYKKDKARKATEQKISAEAEVQTKGLTELDRYLVLGCDGIFEKFSNQHVLDFLLPRLRQRRRRQSEPLSTSCSAFLDANIARIPQKENGLGCDNMTLMVVDLKPSLEVTKAKDTQPAAFSKIAKIRPAMAPFGGAQNQSAGKVRNNIGKDHILSPARRRRMLLRTQQKRKLRLSIAKAERR